MNSFFETSAFFGVIISMAAYIFGTFLRTKLNFSILNPLLTSICAIIFLLYLLKIDYHTYYTSAKYLNYLLTPATICLAIPLYEKFFLLKNNWKAIFAGITSGIVTNLSSILIMAYIFNLTHKEYVTFLPKSITTSIGMDISQKLGGYTPITIASIIVTGIVGNIFSDFIFRLFKINSAISKGISLGTSSHIIGTTKALELGETEAALSSLSIIASGIITVAGASIFAEFL